jgi:DNA-binding LacI/PurR family transcriptional regulator
MREIKYLKVKVFMATLKDIASIAGVNKSTVSRALDGSPGVSEEKRNEIRKIADELGYIPDETARMLAGKNGKTIGIILPEIDCNYYASVVGAIEKKLKERGYSLIIGQSGFEYQNELHYLNLFIRKKVDGIIFNLYNTDTFIEQLDKIKKIIKIPIVFIETALNLTEYDVIEIDNNHGIGIAVEHMIKSGCEKVGFISDFLSSKIRLPIFEKALRKSGIPVDKNLIKTGKERQEEGGYLRMNELIDQGNLPDAVFASYDRMALGALKAMAEHGVRVPQDVSIVGFDNVSESPYFPVPLTTVSPPVVEMGEMAVKILLDKIRDKENSFVQHISLKPKLIERSSTRTGRLEE